VRQTFSGRVSQILDSWTSGKSGQVSGKGSHDIDKYNALHDDKKTSVEGRNAAYVDLVNSYYNLATDFYEWGWGQSFHFAERLQGEDFGMSIARHEYYLAMRLGIQPSDHVLDCGCGIGGPLRRFWWPVRHAVVLHAAIGVFAALATLMAGSTPGTPSPRLYPRSPNRSPERRRSRGNPTGPSLTWRHTPPALQIWKCRIGFRHTAPDVPPHGKRLKTGLISQPFSKN
jgi:hypothetical protein